MNELVLITENKEVAKAQALVKSRYKLNPLALKLITNLIAMVQKEDTPEQEYIISIKDYIEKSELKGKSAYENLKEACLEIMSKPIHIGKKGTKDFLVINWASSCEYVHNEAIIKFQISPKLLPFIINLKEKYLKYDIKNILSLKSEYVIRLYEWLKDEFNTKARYGKNVEIEITINELREKFEIPASYQWQHMKERVLNKAQKDLLEHTDIKFEWEVASKIRKAVHSIRFKVFKNDKNIPNDIKLPNFLNSFLDFVNWLKDKYRGNSKHFFFMNFLTDEKDKKELHFFGINKDNLVYATHWGGGMGKTLDKNKAQIVLNAAYLCALHSEIYRNMIISEENFFEIFRNMELKELFGIIKNEVINVLKDNDPRQRPLM